MSHTSIEVEPFRIDVPDDALDDLRRRLAFTRYPDQIGDSGWNYGADTAYVQELCEYWRDTFDWRSSERLLNRFDQFRTVIDGARIQFVHQRSDHPDALPLLLLHGWPGSIFEFHKVIEPLTNPPAGAGPAFHVVCPSLPGFVWSGPATSPGWDVRRIARAFADLMAGLGYQRYGVQGGDWGAIIGTEVGLAARPHVRGLHLNLLLVREPADPIAGVTDKERHTMHAEQEWLASEMGYDGIQSTKPQTIGAALHDSPAGLAAWIVEKYRAWSDCAGDVERRFTKDELLTTVTSYWVTGTITSSMRLYFEYSRMEPRFGTDGFVGVPTACAIFPAEMYHPPRAWVEARYDVRRWTEMPSGGHFAALEEPDLLVEDLRSFFATSLL